MMKPLKSSTRVYTSISPAPQSILLFTATFQHVIKKIIKRMEYQSWFCIKNISFKTTLRASSLQILQIVMLKLNKNVKYQAFCCIKNIQLSWKKITKGFKIISASITKAIKQAKRLALLKIKDISDDRFGGSGYSRPSIKSGRRSESSNLLTVSETSISHSRLLILEEGKEYSQRQILCIRNQNEQLKRMTLSEQARDALIKMQRFDRYIFGIESQKVLRQPISNELKRLEKMKNQTKQMRAKFYDNQLTITCLYNHIKLIGQFNKELADLTTIKAKKIQLQKSLTEISGQHRKQISQYKKKLLFMDIGSKGKLDSSFLKQKIDVVDNESQINSDEQKTLNFLVIALKKQQYSDAYRQINYLIKISNKKYLQMILKQVITLLNEMETTNQQKKQLEKMKLQILNNLSLFGKHLRGQKWEELEKLKISCSVYSPIEVTQLFGAIINLSLETRTLRKKRLSSSKKQKQQTFRSSRQIDESYIQTLRGQITTLSKQKQQINEKYKKLQRSRLSHPPKNLSAEKNVQLNSKTKEIEDIYKKQIQQLKIKQKNSQARFLQRINLLEKEINKMKDQQKQDKLKLKEYGDALLYYQRIREKSEKKMNYLNQIIQFKSKYSISYFNNIFNQIQMNETYFANIIDRLKNTTAFFNDSDWRDKQKIHIEQEDEISIEINKLIQIIYKIQENKQLKYSKQFQQIKQRQQFELMKDNKYLLKIMNQKKKFETPQKQLLLEKYQILEKENQKLKNQLEELRNQVIQSPRIYMSPIMELSESKSSSSKHHEYYEKTKELEDFLKYYQEIKEKKENCLPYLRQLNQLKMDYPDSVLVELLENSLELEVIQKSQIHHLQLLNIAFSEDNKNDLGKLLVEEKGQFYQNTNKIIYEILKLNQTICVLNQQILEIHHDFDHTKHQNLIKNEQISRLTNEILEASQTIKCLHSQIENTKAELILLKRRKENEAQQDRRSNSPNAKLIACEQKLASYRLLLEKAKIQKQNIRRQLEQKKEEYEICKQSEQNYISENLKMAQEVRYLKQTLDQSILHKNQLQKQRYQIQQQKDQVILESINFKANIQNLQRDLKNKNLVLQESKRHIIDLELINTKYKSQVLFSHENMKKLEQRYDEAEKKIAELETHLHNSKIQKQRRQLELELLLQAARSDQQLLKKIAETRINYPIHDDEKKELRRQLQLANAQIANSIRNSQNELRESRRYIQQLIDEVQSKGALHSQQKRILRQQVQRARCQQYEINQDKIRRLREDVQILRQENQRLSRIIQENEGPFNRLVDEHRQMCYHIQRIQQMLESARMENKFLISEAEQAKGKNDQLVSQLDKLEEKIVQLEQKFSENLKDSANHEQILREKEGLILQLQISLKGIKNDNFILQKMVAQKEALVEKLSQTMMMVEADAVRSREIEINNLQKGFQMQKNEYICYLEEKVAIQATKISEQFVKEGQLANKIQLLIKNIDQLTFQKQQLELQIHFNNELYTRQCNQLRRQISNQKNVNNFITHKNELEKEQDTRQQTSLIKQRLMELQDERQKYLLEISKLKQNSEQGKKIKNSLQIKNQQNLSLSLEIKRLQVKYIKLQEILRQRDYNIRQMQDYLVTITQKYKMENIKQIKNDFTNNLLEIEELRWLRDRVQELQKENEERRMQILDLKIRLQRCNQEKADLTLARQTFSSTAMTIKDLSIKLKHAEQVCSAHIASRQRLQNQFLTQINLKNAEISILREQISEIQESRQKMKNKILGQHKLIEDLYQTINRHFSQNHISQVEKQSIQLLSLNKICLEVNSLLQINNQYKQKIIFMENQGYTLHVEALEADWIKSFKDMLTEFLDFINRQQIMSNQEMYNFSIQTEFKKLLQQFGILLRVIFTKLQKQREDEISRYELIIENIYSIIRQVCGSGKIDRLQMVQKWLNDAGCNDQY